jgi:general secretion pathway protein D
MLWPVAPLEARTRKGDKFLAEGRVAEQKKQWDAALEAYEKALSEDPADIVYQMAMEKCRFQTAQSHIDLAIKLRGQGQLGEALPNSEGVFHHPGSAVAEQKPPPRK